MRQAKDLFMLQIVLGLLAIGIALFLWERFPAFKWVLATIFGVPLAVLSIGLLIENARKTEDAAAASKASATTPEARQLAQSNIEKAPAAEKKKCPDSGTLADLWDCTADVRKGGR